MAIFQINFKGIFQERFSWHGINIWYYLHIPLGGFFKCCYYYFFFLQNPIEAIIYKENIVYMYDPCATGISLLILNIKRWRFSTHQINYFFFAFMLYFRYIAISFQFFEMRPGRSKFSSFCLRYETVNAQFRIVINLCVQ